MNSLSTPSQDQDQEEDETSLVTSQSRTMTTQGSQQSGNINPSNYLDIHELSKGWKAAISRTTDPLTRHEAHIKNDRGNLPIHSSASFRAPLEVSEALLDAYPDAASQTNNYGNLALHFTAWKKGPVEVERLLLRLYPEGAAQKNNHGNLPLHYAAHYNAPLEVVEALYEAYPEAALQKNNDQNTPLDLAIADGASPNVIALLQGKSVPPTEEEVLDSAKSRVDSVEKELQMYRESHSKVQSDLDAVVSLLLDLQQAHPHALYCAGLTSSRIHDSDSLLEQLRQQDTDDTADDLMEQPEEDQTLENALIPPDDTVEVALSKIIALESVKNHIRGLRRTIEINAETPASEKDRLLPRHLVLIGGPGTGKSYVARMLMPLLHQIGAVSKPVFIEASRDDLVDRRSRHKTLLKTQAVLQAAKGGVLFVDEAYTLLPSLARPRNRDHGEVVLRELAKALPSGDPLLILAGYPSDLELVMASDIGFRGNFLLKLELPDLTPTELSQVFFLKLQSKGFIPSESLSIPYLTSILERSIDAGWRAERNGHLVDALLNAVRLEMKKRRLAESDAVSVGRSPIKLSAPGSNALSNFDIEDVIVSAEDVKNALDRGI